MAPQMTKTVCRIVVQVYSYFIDSKINKIELKKKTSDIVC